MTEPLRLATRHAAKGGGAVLVRPNGDVAPVHAVGGPVADALTALRRWGSVDAVPRPDEQAWTSSGQHDFDAPVRGMQTVLGVGLNFVGHAGDLQARTTRVPTLFYKGAHTLIGPGTPIVLPAQSQRVTAEAELALVIGRPAYRLSVTEALAYVGGVCCVLDQTAEDLLLEDSRLLTLAKNFPTFLASGPELASLDELVAHNGSLDDVRVETWLNGTPVRAGTVAEMRFGPAELVSFISHMTPLDVGDVICTGTPGAVRVQPGDTVECRITGLRPLVNPVVADHA